MPKLDLSQAPVKTGSIYPAPHDAEVAGRSSLRLGDLAGLTQFGVNIVVLEPGARASMRHWHEKEDEFLIVLEGELLLVDEAGEHPMRPGDCAAFKAGEADGHHMVNRSEAEARFLVVGSKAADEVAHYPDHGLKLVMEGGKPMFFHEDGRPFEPTQV
jgi:uncharacterized cupin superfamily protein